MQINCFRKDKSYIVKKKKKQFSETDIIKMLQFLIDTIFVMLGGCAFQQKFGIPKGTNCVLLLVELFIYWYEADVIQGPPKKIYEKLARSFNFTFHYTDGICH